MSRVTVELSHDGLSPVTFSGLQATLQMVDRGRKPAEVAAGAIVNVLTGGEESHLTVIDGKDGSIIGTTAISGVEFVKAWGGTSAGHFAYHLITGSDPVTFDEVPGLAVFDVSEPSSPVHLAIATSETDPNVCGVDIRASLVAGGHTRGFNIFDVSTPSAPSQIATIDFGGTTGSGRRDVAFIDDSYLIVVGRARNQTFDPDFGDQSHSFWVFDISNPSAPTYVTSLEVIDGFADSVVVHEGVAYVGGGNRPLGSVAAVDISDPTAPVILNQIIGNSLIGHSVDAAIVDGHLLLCSYDSGGNNDNSGAVTVVDISNPSSLNILSGAEALMPVPWMFAVVDNEMFVARWFGDASTDFSGSVYKVDATNPTSLQLSGDQPLWQPLGSSLDVTSISAFRPS